MEPKGVKIIASAVVISLLILITIFRVTLGHSTAFYLVTGAACAAILAVVIWALFQYATVYSRTKTLTNRTALEGEQLRLEYSFLRKAAGLPAKFRYEELEAATDNFKALLGRGSSASVFKGILDDGTPVAVKRIEGAEHGEREFRSEVAAIASVQHVNLVRLLGYCCVPGGGFKYLVYEFIHNGSLDSWIFPRRGGSFNGEGACLPWSLRYKIAIDVAKALAYLHHDCRSRILHLDVKPENILLDESFRARMSDFGLSKLMGRDESRVVTTVRGTRGYLAPEWLLENGISEKSDIYSYGMVLLEIFGGRRNVRLVGDGSNSQRKWSYFPRIVSEKVKEGKLMEVLDEKLKGGGVEEREVRVLVNVALWCIQEKAKLRPSMARVVDMLEGRLLVDKPPETEMIIVDLLSIDDDNLTGAGGSRQMQSKPPTMSTYSCGLSVLSGR
ncbi:hypothetical protein AAC387_Pa02g2285 [Persea americana]